MNRAHRNIDVIGYIALA